jgi:hypothetical protein
MASLSARMVALTDQILAALDEESPLPVSTVALWRKLSPPCDGWPHTACRDRHLDYTAVYRALCRLARLGEIEKWAPDSDSGRRSCLWRRLTIPEDGDG